MSFLILTLIIIAQSEERILIDQRDEEFLRINKYELVYFNDTEIIEIDNKFIFDAFGQHYEIELTRNDDYHVANIRHPSIDNKLDQHFSQKQLKQSCHYFGKVINTEEPSETRVTLSLCDNAGIRGRIDAFDDVIMINPSAYFLDKAKDSRCEHKLDDEHLLYKLSDFDMSDIHQDDTINVDEFKGTDDKQDKLIEAKTDTMADNGRGRRRLYTTNTLELLVVIDLTRYEYFKSTYGNNWYSRLVEDCSSMISPVSSEFSNTNWGFGSIKIAFVEIEIVTTYSGNYASLKPDYLTSTSVSANWLDKFADWLQQNKNMNSFDNAHLFTNARFYNGASGIAHTGKVCLGQLSSGVEFMGYGTAASIRTLAHEMGHNFGMVHDGPENSCNVNDGLMGYGSGTRFSSCSIQEANTYYNSQNTLTCLRSGWTSNEWRTNYESDIGLQPECNTYSCVGIYQMPVTPYGDFNGYWKPISGQCHNGQAVYSSTSVSGLYLHYSSVYSKWIIGDQPGGRGAVTYSPSESTSVVDTSRLWYVYNNGWIGAGQTYVYDCGGAAANNEFDDSCLGEYKYGDKLCISRANDYPEYMNENETDSSYTLWNGNKTFEIDNCLNSKPIYQYTENTTQTVEDPLLGIITMGIGLVYYLHHYEQLRYSDGNETYGQWIISKDKISTNALAICEEDNLLDCTKSSWLVGDLKGDSFSRVIDEVMELANGGCEYEEDNIDDGTDGNTEIMIIFVVIIVGLIGCGIGLYLWIRRQKRDLHRITNHVRNEQGHQDLETELSPKKRKGETIQEHEQEIIVDATISITTHTYD